MGGEGISGQILHPALRILASVSLLRVTMPWGQGKGKN